MNAPIVRDHVNRTTGIAALIATTAFVAVRLHLQHVQPTTAQSHSVVDMSASTTRFSADIPYLPNEPLLGFVQIPAGSFVMGSDPAIDRIAYANERWSTNQTQGTVVLPTFYIGRYEVTVAQFAAFATATDRSIPSSALHTPSDYPITDVSWVDALSYARWLESTLRQSTQTPAQLKTLLEQGWQIALPSEAQWEKAARGMDGRIYPWGNDTSASHANFGGGTVKPVGSFACETCSFRLADMSGNVWELTRSPYRPYPYDARDRGDPHADALYVMRGGSFNDTANNVRAATRGGIDPGARRDFIGFRVALTPPRG